METQKLMQNDSKKIIAIFLRPQVSKLSFSWLSISADWLSEFASFLVFVTCMGKIKNDERSKQKPQLNEVY